MGKIVIIIFEFNIHDYQFNRYCVKFVLVHIITPFKAITETQ